MRSAGNAGQGPSSIFGIWPPRSSRTTSSWPGGTRMRVAADLDVHAEPRERRAGSRSRSSASTSSIVRSPPVTAARPMKLPTSMWSGAIRHSPPPRPRRPRCAARSSRCPRSRAPSSTRKRQRSWTCGSQAALPITVSPSARTAAMIVFSVAITLASSRKTCAPRSASARMSYGRRSSTSAPSSSKAWMCGSSRRRPITSPPGGGTSRGRSARAAGPRGGTTRGSGGRAPRRARVVVDGRRATRTSFGPIHAASAPRSASSSTIVSTSRMRGTFASVTGSSVSRHAARIGSAPFLFPAARTRPLSGLPALDDEGLARASGDDRLDQGGLC